MRTHAQTLLVSVLLAGSLLLAACGSPTQGQAELEGTQWVLVEMDGERVEFEGEQRLTLIFDMGQVAGYSGCNQFSGDYSANPQTGSLEIGPLTTTLMACLDDDLMRLEGDYQSALQAAEAYSMTGTGLRIETAEGTLVFEEEAIGAY